LISEPISWLQFLPITQFFTVHIPSSLASAGSVVTITPEWEYAAPIAMAHTQEGNIKL
jgi:hypothetical protein